MANMDTQFESSSHELNDPQSPAAKWSGRRTIIVALAASAALWIAIFYLAKLLIA